MKLDENKIKPNEEKSNPAVQAFCSEECDIAGVCFYVATEFGGAIINKCNFLTDDGECSQDILTTGA